MRCTTASTKRLCHIDPEREPTMSRFPFYHNLLFLAAAGFTSSVIFSCSDPGRRSHVSVIIAVTFPPFFSSFLSSFFSSFLSSTALTISVSLASSVSLTATVSSYCATPGVTPCAVSIAATKQQKENNPTRIHIISRFIVFTVSYSGKQKMLQ